MKKCDENIKLDDSFATNKKMSLCGRKIFCTEGSFQISFSKISL